MDSGGATHSWVAPFSAGKGVLRIGRVFAPSIRELKIFVKEVGNEDSWEKRK